MTGESAPPEHVGARDGVFHILDGIAPMDLHRAVWDACMQPTWMFGNRSTEGESGRPFWKMELGGVEAIDRLFAHVRPACERLAGTKLRVVRQYANGHTYGLGGQPHFDDVRPGTYTLLYYPMPAWKPEWEGETLFFSDAGHVAAGVAIAPNRGVFFDARMSHAGRAPSRDCPELRVTVAYKLEATHAS
jgi:SM-20-related protein